MSSPGTRSGTGTPVPARRTSAFALVASPDPRHTEAMISALLLLALPLSFLGGVASCGRGPARRPAGFPAGLFFGALSYALVPATSGAWGIGRLRRVAVAALLPWLAHAALGFVDPDPDLRWRAGLAVRAAAALGTAFVAPILALRRAGRL